MSDQNSPLKNRNASPPPTATAEFVSVSPADHVIGIPRLIYLGRILALCFYPLAAVVLGDVVLLLVPQASEALLAFGDNGQFATQAVAFEFAFVLWMISAWYVARLLVGRRFNPDLIGSCSNPGFAACVAKWLPRALALLAGVPIALRITWRGQSGWLGPLLIASSIVVLLGLAFRRQLAVYRHQKWLASWHRAAHEDFERFNEIAAAGLIFIAILSIIGAVLWLAIPFFMEPLARFLGTPAILLFALMSWTVFGGFLLTYVPKSLHVTGWSWALVFFAFLCYPINENHRVTDGKAGTSNLIEQRIPVERAFSAWLSRRKAPDAPVILIATAGGASRAAYWTASSLGKLEDEITPRGTFSRDVFVISSISGGSLGAAAFVSAVAERQRHPETADQCNSVRYVGRNFTGRDHLATVVGMMLFPDLVGRFLPFGLHFWDRSRGLEEVWTRDWARVQQDCRDPQDPASNPWAKEFLQLHRSAGENFWLPMLALSSTALDAGRPVLQADFQLFRSDAFDLLSGEFATGTLTLTEAVHNSARFPYVSPGGQVRLWDKAKGAAGPVWDRLGDGGYVEASGTLTLSEIIRELRTQKLIRSDVEHGGCTTGSDGSPSCFVAENQLKVLVLDNSPVEPSSWLCGISKPGDPDGHRDNIPQSVARGSKPFLPVIPDLTVPLDGAFSTRGGRAVTSQVDLLELMDGCTDRFAELRFPKPSRDVVQPSMNWMLNKQSRDEMDAALDAASGTDSSAAITDNLNRIHGWFGAPAADGH